MLELALRLNAKRVRRGSIDFDLPEPVVEFDPDGNMKAIVRSERGWSHRLIEEFMLSANECVATWLERLDIPSIYRIHEMPDPKRIVDFEETAAGFGHSLGLGSLPVRKLTMKSDRRDSRAKSSRGHDPRSPQRHEIPESIPVTPQMYQKLVRRISGTLEERILAYLMLRSLKQARYAEQNEGHFALASPSYTHFTSPIRRYPDLIVHRLVRAMLRRGSSPLGGAITSTDPQPWQADFDKRHKPPQSYASTLNVSSPPKRSEAARPASPSPTQSDNPPIPAEELSDIATESSQSERRAADAERELIEWKKIKFMQDRVGEDFRAVILSCNQVRLFRRTQRSLHRRPRAPWPRSPATSTVSAIRTGQLSAPARGTFFRWGKRSKSSSTASTASSGACSSRFFPAPSQWPTLVLPDPLYASGKTETKKVRGAGEAERQVRQAERKKGWQEQAAKEALAARIAATPLCMYGSSHDFGSMSHSLHAF